jgi:hypothetical protein
MSVMDVLDSVGRDLRYALRSLRRRPAFTSAAHRHALIVNRP